ncbi:MAG: DUF4115 domain-containing protein [Alphaproteobacteria bacterium]|nr:DUF4115 domain-containing protein [Alphaproteobacteria bacterium]
MSNVNTNANSEFYTDIPVGEILRRARTQAKLTIPQVEIALRIRAQLLEALERSDYSQLPGPVYTIGFVRTYAEFLGLDGNKMIALLKTQTGNSQWRAELHLPVAVRETNMPNLLIICGSVGLLIVLIIIAMFQYGRTQGEAEIGYPPLDIVDSSLTQELAEGLLDGTITETFDDAAVETDNAPYLTIKALQDTWFELRNKETGAVLYSGLLKEGTTFKSEDTAQTSLDTGNAGGLEIAIEDTVLPALGATGEVKRGVLLEKPQNP